MLALLGLLPALTFPSVAYAARPAGPVFAPVRLALVRAALVLGASAVLTVEILSALHSLTAGVLTAVWVGGLLVAAGASATRYRWDARHGTARLPWRAALDRMYRAAARPERLLAFAIGGLLLAELVVALGSPPNNFDSQTYHLPKIEHWVAQHDVEFYATRIHRQLSIAPGAEYLLLHLRLLTGGDVLYNMLQWLAGAACVVLASRIAGQLGGGRRAQMLAGFVVGMTPIIALEATSTQTDLVVAGWVACVATLTLDQLRKRSGVGEVLLLGAAVGLTSLTKATGLLAAAPLLVIWLTAQLWQARAEPLRRIPRAVASGAVILLVGFAIAGPYVDRVDETYHNPLGPPYLRDSISMQRHDPGAILVNALRIGQTAVEIPIAPVNRATAHGVIGVAHLIGVNPNDPEITFTGTNFPSTSWWPDEDHASFPIEGILVLVGALILAVRPRRSAGGSPIVLRGYAIAFWVTLVLYVATVKWQPWGNRLILFVLVLGAPLAGLWVESLFRRAAVPAVVPARAVLAAAVPTLVPAGAGPTVSAPPPPPAEDPPADPTPADPTPADPTPAARTHAGWRRGTAAWTAGVALVVAGVAGWLAVGYGWPRRLVGGGSVFAESRMDARFNRRPAWRVPYEDAAAAVRASGAHRVGLVQGEDSWEYPWWVLLRGDDIVPLQSLVPTLKAARPGSVDAIICTVPRPICRYYTPKGWTLHYDPNPADVGYSLPPGR